LNLKILDVINKIGENIMPLVKIEIIEGKSSDYKNAIMNALKQSIIQTLNVTEYDIFQRLLEFKAEDLQIPPDKSHNVTLIEIILYKGRSYNIKKDLYTAIMENLIINPGINKSDLIIVLMESNKENWVFNNENPSGES
jgi:phenylpyruvate tautomerase PptA (4-oxalocrotonate tautomerase family)